jgi:hypothetical protein
LLVGGVLGDAVRAWIEAHPVLDGMLVVVVFLALFGTTALAGRPRDLRSLKVLGQEIEFFETLESVEQNTVGVGGPQQPTYGSRISDV